jgi:hypothetical protein
MRNHQNSLCPSGRHQKEKTTVSLFSPTDPVESNFVGSSANSTGQAQVVNETANVVNHSTYLTSPISPFTVNHHLKRVRLLTKGLLCQFKY